MIYPSHHNPWAICTTVTLFSCISQVKGGWIGFHENGFYGEEYKKVNKMGRDANKGEWEMFEREHYQD